MKTYELVIEKKQPTCGGRAPTKSEIKTVTTADPVAYVRGLEPNGKLEVETTANGVYSVEDTATIETWYRPDITAACRIVLANDTTAVYEIVGTPEDIEMRHQFMQIRVRRVKGGA